MESAEINGQEHDRSILAGWISRNELARELDVTTDTLGRWVAQRKGPTCVKAGRKTFYRREDVQAWLRVNEVKPIKKRTKRGRR